MKKGNGAHYSSNEIGYLHKTWSVNSYKNFPIQQQPKYCDKIELERVLNKVELTKMK